MSLDSNVLVSARAILGNVMSGKDKSIVIIETDRFAAAERRRFFRKQGFRYVALFHSINDFLSEGNWDFQFAIIDVAASGDISAFELVGIMKQRNKAFILLADKLNEKQMAKVLTVQPNGFFYKPVKNEDLRMAILMVDVNKQNSILVKGRFGAKSVHPSEIQLIQTQKNYLDIIAIDGHYTRRDTLKNIMQELPDSFVRVNRFFVVNTNYIEQYSGSQLLVDSRIIPISRNFKGQLAIFA